MIYIRQNSPSLEVPNLQGPKKKHASIFLIGVFMSWFPQTKRTREAS